MFRTSARHFALLIGYLNNLQVPGTFVHRMYILLAIASLLWIGCREINVSNRETASPIPTLITAETVVQPTLSPVTSLSPTVLATITAPPTEESTKEIWQEYVNEEYGFSFSYPTSLTLVELPNRPNQVSLVFPGTSIALRIRFRHSGETVNLQQYGGAAGDFISRGTVNFLGDDVEKVALVYQDVDKEIHYNETSEIIRGDILFTLAVESNRSFDQAVIPETIQAAADEVLETFKLLGEQK